MRNLFIRWAMISKAEQRTCRFLLGLFVFLLGSFCTKASCDDEVALRFRLHAPQLPNDTDVFIAGSVPELGRWNPGKIKMTSQGDHVWTHEIQATPGKSIEYKYTLGSWAREGATDDGRPLPNFEVRAKSGSRTDDQIDHWTKGGERKVVGQVTGTVKYHRQIEREGLRKRDIVVWLPAGYATSDARYPVLYMHDGQNIVDPKNSAFGVDWQIDETCTRLISERSIQPLIVVGIYNTRDRSAEYMPTDKGQVYRDFVVDDVRALINKTYRTKTDRTHTFTGGSSAGGLCAFMLAWERSDIFAGAVCMSPAFKFSNSESSTRVDYVSVVAKSQRPQHPVFFYIDNGGVGLEQSLQKGIDAMLSEFDAKELRKDKDYVWVHDPEARHSEAAWAKRFPHAIQTLLNRDPIE